MALLRQGWDVKEGKKLFSSFERTERKNKE